MARVTWHGQRLLTAAGVNLCRRRELEQAKGAERPARLKRLDQKGGEVKDSVPVSSIADVAPLAQRQDLPRVGTRAKRGKPVALPLRRRAIREADRAVGKG
jgi:hypothetical protein